MAKNGKVRIGVDPYLAVSKKKIVGAVLVAFLANAIFYGSLAAIIFYVAIQILGR